jgi:amidase
MARTVGDAALMLSVMAGPADDRAPMNYAADTRAFRAAVVRPSVKGWRIAWTPDLGGLVTVDPEVASAVERAAAALGKLGARVERASPDMGDVPDVVALTRGFLMVARHADKLERWEGQLQAGLVENTRQGLGMSARDVARGELLRTRLWQRVRAFLETRDVWLMPTAAVPAFPIELPHAMEIGGKPAGKTLQRSYLTYAFSVLGLPAISVPCGFTREGLPIGLQIVGRPRQEATVLRAAAAFEEARPWAQCIPPVVTRSR